MQGIVAEELWNKCCAIFSQIPLVGCLLGREVQDLTWRDHLIHGGLVATIVAVALALFQGSFLLAALCLSLTVPLLFASHYVNRYQELLNLQARVELLSREISTLHLVNQDLRYVIGNLDEQNRIFRSNNARLNATRVDLEATLEANRAEFAAFRGANEHLQAAVIRHEELVKELALLEERIRELIREQELQQRRLDDIRAAFAVVHDDLRKEVRVLGGVRDDLGRYVGQLPA